jgi:hypothetical protein
LRDFWRRLIFDFFDSIDPKRTGRFTPKHRGAHVTLQLLARARNRSLHIGSERLEPAYFQALSALQGTRQMAPTLFPDLPT